MRLTKLALSGFKSFADKTEIEFAGGITGVVGPNGTGKSNISDAVRWALGEQSARQIRGQKMEDIIFNGSERRKPTPWCEVTVTLDNEKGELPADAAEIALTRRLYRTGVSEASINRASCRMKDVSQLLYDTGIGREGYALIGQGRVDEILSQKPEERRAVFEEAAGITGMRARKDEAERRIAQAEQNRARVDDQLNVMGEQLDILAEESRVARQYLAARERLREIELNQFVADEDTAKKKRADLSDIIAALDTLGVEERISALANERERLEEGVRRLSAQADGVRQTQLAQVKAYERHRGEISRLMLEIDHAKRNRDDSLERESRAKLRVSECDGLMAKLTGESAAANVSLSRLRSDLAALEASFDAEREAERAAEETLEAHKARTIDALNRRSMSGASRARLETMRQSIIIQMEDIEAEAERLAKRRGALQAEADEAVRHGEAAAAKLAGTDAERDAAKSRRAENDRALSGLQAKANEARNALGTITARLTMLRDMAESYDGFQNAVRQALKLKTQPSGAFSDAGGGICGVVAELISTPREIETAVEMALGAALQNIVTEDEHTAKRLIEYLRQGRYGRATFLPLTTVRGRTLSPSERAALSVDGCLGVASEMLSCEARYRGIVESLLGRTVIARDMDAGLAIMKRGGYQFRTVTLLGDMLHQGGSMTGGSLQNRNSQVLSRVREIDELSVKQAEVKARIDEIAKRELDIIARGEAIRSDETALSERSQSWQVEFAGAAARQSASLSALKELSEREREVSERRDQLRFSLNDVSEQLSSGEREGEPHDDPDMLQLQTPALIDARNLIACASERRELNVNLE